MEIYLTTNLINGKIYVGQSKLDDSSYLGSGTLIVKAICKYGKENFSKTVIEIVNDEKMLDEKEIFWIAFFKNRDYKMYNVQSGGRGWCRKVLNDYWRKRKEEDRLAILQILQNVKTDLHITSSKKKHKSFKIPLEVTDIENEWHGKKIFQFNMNGEFLRTFSNLDHAVNSIGYKSKGNLSMACNGLRNECGGYRWSYNEIPNNIKDSKKGRKKGTKDSSERIVSHKTYTTRTIIQKDLNGNIIKIWNHSREVSQILNLSRQLILRFSKLKTEYKGFLWEQGEKNVITEYK